jgi:hypothetical protein
VLAQALRRDVERDLLRPVDHHVNPVVRQILIQRARPQRRQRVGVHLAVEVHHVLVEEAGDAAIDPDFRFSCGTFPIWVVATP